MAASLQDYAPRPLPRSTPVQGALVRLEPIRRDHLDGLFEAFTMPGGEGLWTYLAYGPFADRAAFDAFAENTYFGQDPFFYAIVSELSGKPLGVLALMRIDRVNAVIEIGNICFSPALQRSRAASETFLLAAETVFDGLGYRRYEWKCDSGNLPSRKAAERLGFSYEGLFRQHMIVKGRNRDTAWFSIIDTEWPTVKAAYRAYLSDDNFDVDGRQHRPMGDCLKSA